MPRIARMLEVVTSPVNGFKYITTVGGTFESIRIDGRWSHHTVWQVVNEQINLRIKCGILKANIGYAVYNYGAGRAITLESIHVVPEFADLPRRFL